MYSEKSVVRFLESWCKEHLGRHDDLLYAKYIQHFQRHLSTKREEQQLPHENNGRFGMSKAGGCLRAAALSWAGVKGEDFTGSTRAVFEVGHLLECMTLAILEASGFVLRGTQVVCDLPPAHYSYADGVLLSGPVELPYPIVLSVKTQGYKTSGRTRDGWKRYGFAALPLDGIRQGQHDWFVQSQLEMAALDLRHALVLVVAKDMVKAMEADPIMQESGSLTFYAELLAREEGFERPYQEMAGEVLSVLSATLSAAGPEEAQRVAVAVHPIVSRPGRFVQLPAPGDTAAGWGGENQKACGDFNRCNGCTYAERCRA